MDVREYPANRARRLGHLFFPPPRGDFVVQTPTPLGNKIGQKNQTSADISRRRPCLAWRLHETVDSRTHSANPFSLSHSNPNLGFGRNPGLCQRDARGRLYRFAVRRLPRLGRAGSGRRTAPGQTESPCVRRGRPKHICRPRRGRDRVSASYRRASSARAPRPAEDSARRLASSCQR